MATKPIPPDIQREQSIGDIVDGLFASYAPELLAFWSFVDLYIRPNARKIQSCTSASFFDCVKSAVLILGDDDQLRFDMLCGSNGIDSIVQAAAIIDAANVNAFKKNGSIGEIVVDDTLSSLKIEFEREKRFPELGSMRFDFYIKKYHAAIEYDGLQHSKSVALFGGDAGLAETVRRDEIKNKYCEAAGIRLLRIPHDADIAIKVKDFIHGLH